MFCEIFSVSNSNKKVRYRYIVMLPFFRDGFNGILSFKGCSNLSNQHRERRYSLFTPSRISGIYKRGLTHQFQEHFKKCPMCDYNGYLKDIVKGQKELNVYFLSSDIVFSKKSYTYGGT